MPESFDIGIVGAGGAGLQLLQQLALHQDWPTQKVLLIDDGSEKLQSWCFWSKNSHPLQHLVTKTWHQLSFRAANVSINESISPYAYHYISGKDFYTYFNRDFIPAHPNVTLVLGKVNLITKTNAGFSISTDDATWNVKQCFSSLLPFAQDKRLMIWQHFKGWYIETEKAVFNDRTAFLMDFSLPTKGKVNFTYLLPFSKNIALIEATYFSAEIADDAVYDDLLKQYIKQKFPGIKFKIKNTEKGCIPMSKELFNRYGPAGEVLIGKAAGMVKATTGYTFNRIANDSALLAQNFFQKKPFAWPATKGRFRFYDQLLLNIIAERAALAPKIFTRLFKYNRLPLVLQFLDEETDFTAEVKIFFTLPIVPFLKEALKQVMKQLM